MTTGSTIDAASPPPRSRLVWRLGTPLGFLLSGVLFVVSAESSEGTDLRPGRYTDLASVVEHESRVVEDLQAQVARLNADIERLTTALGDAQVDRIKEQVERLKDPAGLTAMEGPGVTVTLADAPEDVMESSSQNINYLVVHQQDIQAVVNAMWEGGAEAITIQGQRIISTTGIKCSGNAVRLHGIPYAQPYVISGIGDQAGILRAISESSYLQNYRRQSEMPDVRIGWDLETADSLRAPAYAGVLDLGYARPPT